MYVGKSLLYIIFTNLLRLTASSADNETSSGLISMAQLPSDDDYEIEETTEPANVVINELPVQEHTEIVTVFPSESPPTVGSHVLNLAGYDGSSEQVHKALVQFLSKLVLTPGRALSIKITPPSGVGDNFLEIVLKEVDTIVKLLVTNAECSFKASAQKNSDGVLINILLNITIGPSTYILGVPKSKFLDPVSLNLTSNPVDMKTGIKKILANALEKAEDSLNHEQPVGMIIMVTPPQGSNSEYEQIFVRTVAIVLDGLIPENIRSVVKGKSTNNPDGTVKSIQIIITLRPKNNFQPSITKIVDIDLSVSLEPSEILTEQLSLLIQGLQPQINEKEIIQIILSIFPPKEATEEFANTVMSLLKTILSQLLPSEQFTTSMSSKLNPGGTISLLKITIYIRPGSNSNKHVENISVDLSKPGIDIQKAIDMILRRATNITDIQLQINLKIIPASGATDDYIKNVENTVKAVLSKLIPSQVSKVRTEFSRGFDTSISSIEMVIIIEPNNMAELNFDIDLSQTGSDLAQAILRILPIMKETVSKANLNGESVSFTVNIEPPSGSNDDFIQTVMTTILMKVSRALSNNKIGIQARSTKDNEGNISNISITINVEARKSSHGKIFKIDLTQNGISLIDDLKKVLPDIRYLVRKGQSNNESVSFSLDILPPEVATAEFPSTAMKTVLTMLTKIFPKNQIDIQGKSLKDTEGYIISVNITIRISANEAAVVLDKNEGVNIDLTMKGTDLNLEIQKTIPILKKLVEEAKPSNKIVTFNFNIRAPEGISDQFIRTTINIVLSTLSKVFMKNKFGIQAETSKNSEGDKLNITITVKIEPSTVKPITKQEIIKVDLSKPGDDLVQLIKNMVPDLMNKLNENEYEDKPVNFNLKIQPPKEATENFVKYIKETVTSHLTKTFTNDKVHVEAVPTKNNKGIIINVDLVVALKPRKQPAVINLDLAKPGVSLIRELTEILPDIIEREKNEQPKNKPVNFNMNITAPIGATDEYVKSTTKTIQTVLSKIYPDTEIVISTETTKDTEGSIKNLNLGVSLESKILNETKNAITGETISLDLKERGTNILQEITKALPHIKYTINKGNIKNKPVDLNLLIKAPEDASENFAQQVAKTVSTEFTNKFPKNHVTVKPKIVRDNRGNITSMRLMVNVQPVSQKSIASSSEESPFIQGVVVNTETTTDKINEIIATPGKLEISDQLFGTTRKTDSISEEIQEASTAVNEEILRRTSRTESISDELTSAKTTTNDTLSELTTSPTRSSQSIEGITSKITTTAEEIQGVSTPVNKEILSRTSRTESVSEGLISATTTAEESLIESTTLSEMMKNIVVKTTTLDELTTSPQTIKELMSKTTRTAVEFQTSSYDEKLDAITTRSADRFTSDKFSEFTSNRTTTEREHMERKQNTKAVWKDIQKKTTTEMSRESSTTTAATSVSELKKTTSFPLLLSGNVLSQATPSDKRITTIQSSEITEKTKPAFLERILENMRHILMALPPELIMAETSKTIMKETDIISAEYAADYSKSDSEQSENVDISEMNPRNYLIKQFSRMCNQMYPSVKRDLRMGRPIILNFRIQPPKGKTTSFLRKTIKSIIPIIKKYFPRKLFNIRSCGSKNDNTFTLRVTIRTYQSFPSQPTTINIDLHKTHVRFIDEVHDILRDSLPRVRSVLGHMQPATLIVKVHPPKRTTIQTLKTVAKSLVPVLIEYFPGNGIDILTSSACNPNGYIDSLILGIMLEPRLPKTAYMNIDLSQSPFIVDANPESSPEIIQNFDQGLPLFYNSDFDPRFDPIFRTIRPNRKSCPTENWFDNILRHWRPNYNGRMFAHMLPMILPDMSKKFLSSAESDSINPILNQNLPNDAVRRKTSLES